MQSLCAVLLIACGGDSTGPGPDAIAINGTVVDEFLNPRVGVGVVITGHGRVFTDASGRFSVSGVSRPYDLATGLSFESGAIVYAGLTRRDPMVIVPAHPLDPSSHRAHVWGEVSAATGSPAPSNHTTSVYFESPEVGWVGAVSGFGYSLRPAWRGPATTTGVLHALQWQFDPATGLPVEYTGYGATELVLTPGAYFEGPDVSMASPVQGGSINGAVTVPDSYRVHAKTVLAGFGSAAAAAWAIITDSSSAEDFTYATPDVPGVSFSLRARAGTGDARRDVFRTDLSASANGVVLTIPPAPVLISPEDGFTGVDVTTEFSWTRTNGAVYLLSIIHNGTDIRIPPPPNVYLFTADTTATIPDLRELGMSFYRETPYVWQVLDWTPFDSVDEITVPTWFVRDGDRSAGASAMRRFSMRR